MLSDGESRTTRQSLHLASPEIPEVESIRVGRIQVKQGLESSTNSMGLQEVKYGDAIGLEKTSDFA